MSRPGGNVHTQLPESEALPGAASDEGKPKTKLRKTDGRT
jgi:hypothetical protein